MCGEGGQTYLGRSASLSSVCCVAVPSEPAPCSEQKLFAPDGGEGEEFGAAVAIDAHVMP